MPGSTTSQSKPRGKYKKQKKVESEADRLHKQRIQERRDALIQRLDYEKSRRMEKELRRGQVLKTREVDYTQLRTVRIDRRTSIYIKPGENPEIAKDRFLKTYHKSFAAGEEL